MSARRISWVLVAAVGFMGAAALPAAGEEPVIQEVLEILRERGLVDEARYSELVSKNQRYEEEHQGLLGRIRWSGDFRGRLENFWFDRDAFDTNRDNRMRARYRLRIRAEAEVNEYLDVVMRLASGENDHRSTNRTLGFDDDFGPDAIFIDQAYVNFTAPESWLPAASSLEASFGKVENPFLWKQGKDYMLWDGDINPEGASIRFATSPSDALTLFLNSGYFIVDENSTSVDPHVLGIQGGASVQAAEAVELGARVSWYSWHSINPAFFGRSAASGALIDGLDDEAPSQSNDGFDAGELAAYVRFSGIPNWPILVYAHYAMNFDASSSDLFPQAGEEDTGWGVGVEIGDKKKYVMIGAGYYQLEANFWPAQFTDSDLFDGFTNRKGWTVYGARQILPNTELNITLFLGDVLDSDRPAFASSVGGAERIRLQTDLVVKF